MQTASALLAWGLAAIMLLSVGLRRDGYRTRVREALPRVGDVLPIAEVEEAFGVELNRSNPDGLWLLVLTSTCPGCLGLAPDLPEVTRAASCAGAELVPLVVSGRDGGDSIRAMLRSAGLTHVGQTGPAGLTLLEVYAVPTLLEVTAMGRITRVHNPATSPWPPKARCGMG